jgi:hypothetical protein
LDTPTFGSAAAVIVSAVICSIWSPGRPPETASDQVQQQPAAIDSQAARYEFPEGRAMMHWMAYLEFRQAAARTPR